MSSPYGDSTSILSIYMIISLIWRETTIIRVWIVMICYGTVDVDGVYNRPHRATKCVGKYQIIQAQQRQINVTFSLVSASFLACFNRATATSVSLVSAVMKERKKATLMGE